MYKIAIFIEGEGEVIFIDYLIKLLFEHSKICIGYYELLKSGDYPSRGPYPKLADKDTLILFDLYNIHGDSKQKLKAIISERSKQLLTNYNRILGLKDIDVLYKDRLKFYIKNKGYIVKDYAKLDSNIVRDILNEDNDINSVNLHIYYSIVAIEAWFIGFYRSFRRINNTLSLENIKKSLGIEINILDTDELKNPINLIESIYKLARLNYNKSESVYHNLISKITIEEIAEFYNTDRNKSYTMFLKEFLQLDQNCYFPDLLNKFQITVS